MAKFSGPTPPPKYLQSSGTGSRNRLRRRSPGILILLLLLWSIVIGWGMAQAVQPSNSPTEVAQVAPNPSRSSGGLNPAGATAIATTGTVDPIPSRYRLGQEIYRDSCGSCHIAVPPAVFPTETWQRLLQDPQHYGQQIKPLVDPPRLLVWNYLQTFSRTQLPDEPTPYRLRESRYFQALHPKVDLPRTSIRLSSCATCHPGASQYNFRQLSSQWRDSP